MVGWRSGRFASRSLPFAVCLLVPAANLGGCGAEPPAPVASARSADPWPAGAADTSPPASQSAGPSTAPARPVETERAVRAERLEGSEPPIFVVRAQQPSTTGLVFLHGMCGDGLGYAQSFQQAAARKGTLIAPQADVPCGDGLGAKWSKGVASLDARIVDAFRRLGQPEPITDICVIGMSQGATRAASLARTYPERYTRLISMGAPTAVQAAGLEKLRAAVTMVGQRERKDLMLTSERALRAAGVPARSLIIPDADHAGMGPHPERTMGEALDWLWANSR
ncbi:MAG TPA: alpha/beta fold hydrolase [Polyangiaceae bacterium]|nr:alpha/beta fold hydrolase [Polyangiaceae bacterium]